MTRLMASRGGGPRGEPGFDERCNMALMVKRQDNPLFARPNLKVFVLGAFLILVINDLFTGVAIHASARAMPVLGRSGQVTESDLLRLLQHAIKHPSAEAFFQLSYHHQKRGEFQKAKAYLQRAEALQE